MRLRKSQTPEYPPMRHMSTLITFRTCPGNEGVTLIPAEPCPPLPERDLRVITLESEGFTLCQTFVLPKSSGNIGNISIIKKDPEQLAVDSILNAWATERMAEAVKDYGGENVAICQTMRYLPSEETVGESYVYMALYVR